MSLPGTSYDVLNVARKYIGYKESPAGSNRSIFGAWYGVVGPLTWTYLWESPITLI